MTTSEERLPREEQARREVGHTDVTPVVARALVVCFLLLVAALPAVEWAGLRGSTEPGPWSLLVQETVEPQGAVPGGSWARLVQANRAALARTAAFETALEDQSPVGQRLRPPVQAVLSGWLGAGNERVYVGRDGWLFYRPDVEALTGRGFLDPAQLARRAAAAREFEVAPVPDPRPAIRRFAADLAARGITLILMPTPVKPSVHPGALASMSARPSAPIQNASYEAFIEELRGDGLVVFDPAPSLALAAAAGVPQYLAADTHWRPEVVAREAAALAAFIRAHVELAPVPASGYATQPREARHTGDTASMLDLPDGQSLYPPETVALRFVTGADGDPWRPSRDADVLVLGDSFSNIYSLAGMGWGEASGFVEHLSLALDRPVDRLVQNDQGARATRDLLARELRLDPGRLASTRVVVWQFATRELSFGDWAVVPLP
ncbi:MAG: hypothetical protein Q8L86_12995 [Vicinamibacterales bacterium]|nr:hypothetical protein [Vicinamibacterales bacterium]